MTNIGACHLLCGIAASTFASTNVDAGDVCVSTLNETFDPATATAGTTYGEAVYVDVEGNIWESLFLGSTDSIYNHVNPLLH